VVWRFRVPDGEVVRFTDARRGAQSFTAGIDFGDFVVWRKDDVPAYELAVVADDVAMGITEVVRGEDLLRSTARQLLVYRALGATPPAWRHLPLVRDADGRRLAKRHQALSVRELRERGLTPEEVLALAESGELLPAGSSFTAA
jgi:glutamyl-tRNA synthetase